jgi:VIT1/CCC1 family predicted Fe2+/Mn2+ transporter
MAGLIAGAMSMGAGEYVSVSSQRDTENADLARERAELATQLDAEYEELTAIYQTRGLSRHLAEQVSKELMEHDALGAHARDELGIFTTARARPIQAALTSAIAFSLGALFPVSMAFFVPSTSLIASVIGSSLFLLAILGAIAGAIGGAHPGRGAVRVVFWGVLAQALTTLIGHFMGSSAPL